MFDPKQEVPSVDLCQRLEELGLPQDGDGWYWVRELRGYRYKWRLYLFVNYPYAVQQYRVRALTTRELEEYFHKLSNARVSIEFYHEGNDPYVRVRVLKDGAKIIEVSEEYSTGKLPNVLARVLIRLVEDGHVRLSSQQSQ